VFIDWLNYYKISLKLTFVENLPTYSRVVVQWGQLGGLTWRSQHSFPKLRKAHQKCNSNAVYLIYAPHNEVRHLRNTFLEHNELLDWIIMLFTWRWTSDSMYSRITSTKSLSFSNLQRESNKLFNFPNSFTWFQLILNWITLEPPPLCVQKHTDLLAYYFGHSPDLWHRPLLPNFTSALSWKFRGINPSILVYPSCCSCLNRADVIKVFDGRSSFAPAITVLCNEGSELEVLSTGPDLYIEFVANSEWPGQGFKASFQFQAMDSITSDSPSTGQWSSNCGVSRVHK